MVRVCFRVVCSYVLVMDFRLGISRVKHGGPQHGVESLWKFPLMEWLSILPPLTGGAFAPKAARAQPLFQVPFGLMGEEALFWLLGEPSRKIRVVRGTLSINACKPVRGVHRCRVRHVCHTLRASPAPFKEALPAPFGSAVAVFASTLLRR